MSKTSHNHEIRIEPGAEGPSDGGILRFAHYHEITDKGHTHKLLDQSTGVAWVQERKEV